MNFSGELHFLERESKCYIVAISRQEGMELLKETKRRMRERFVERLFKNFCNYGV